jgi:hypothetical protein
MGGSMTRDAIEQYAEALRPRYRRETKKGKEAILTEFCKTTGYHRKSAIRLLNRKATSSSGRRRGRPRTYGVNLVHPLSVCWHASGYICSKRLAPFMAEMVRHLEDHGELLLNQEVHDALLTMSASTIDRLLRPQRLQMLRRPHVDMRAVSHLRNKIAVLTFADLRGLATGYMETDLVLHCGMTTEGFYLTTLVAVDIHTGWTECEAVWGKGQSRVGGAVDHIRRRLPFRLIGLHSDNGSEFINQTLYSYCQRHDIAFTRSRAHKRNDQPRVEQKNGSLVRRLVGYGRYHTKAACAKLDEIYELTRLHTNFFQPNMKLLRYERRNAKSVKVYDEPRTPYQRLQMTPAVSPETLASYQAIYEQLNPLQLYRDIEARLAELWRLEAVDPASELAARIRSSREEQGNTHL